MMTISRLIAILQVISDKDVAFSNGLRLWFSPSRKQVYLLPYRPTPDAVEWK